MLAALWKSHFAATLQGGKLLAGHLPPHQGHVIQDNGSIAYGGPNPVQLVLQHPEQAVNPRWKLRKTLTESGGINVSMMDELGIKEEWLHRFPNELSGGELQRICVARAVGPRTRYLIADEMTTMLDAITQAQIWQALLRWSKQNGVGILVISHERRLIERICSRVVEWANGAYVR
ncbi:ATP-binding cassette domain-containing protein [Paenibacillus sp. S-38]|uniref:ATP-binding cassette domain-containing protein n=1 Tax=Paenibacillus sp. S-38 TaxID=3416710 RepID=UPI003CF37304